MAHLHHFNNGTITWGKDTRRLRRLLLELDFTQVVYLEEKNFSHLQSTSCQEVRRWLESPPPKSWLCSARCCGARDLDHWVAKEERVRRLAQQEQEEVFRLVRQIVPTTMHVSLSDPPTL